MKPVYTALRSAIQTLTYALLVTVTAPAIAQELNVYSARQGI